MRRNAATGLFAIALCLALGCGDDDGPITQTDAGRTDSGTPADAGEAIDCTGASAAAGEAAAVSTCAIAGCHNSDFVGQRGGAGFAAPNLTPHETGLGGWTLEEIASTTLDGVAPDGEVLCAIMPRYRTSGVSEEEACDIAAYLLSLEPIENDVPDTCD